MDYGLTLEPFDLGGGSVPFLIATGYSKDDCRLRCHIDMGCSYRLGGDVTLAVFTSVHSCEGQLVGLRWVVVLYGQVDRKFGDFSLALTWRLPRKMCAVVGL